MLTKIQLSLFDLIRLLRLGSKVSSEGAILLWIAEESMEYNRSLDPEERLDVLGCFVLLGDVRRDFLDDGPTLRYVQPYLDLFTHFAFSEEEYISWQWKQIRRGRLPLKLSDFNSTLIYLNHPKWKTDHLPS